VIRVVPLEPAIHAATGDAGLDRDGRDLAAVNVGSHGTASTPFGDVILEFRFDDEGISCLSCAGRRRARRMA
jgi:hypothetical protein